MADDQKLSTRIVDLFGTAVADMVPDKPELARDLLIRAFEVKRFQTRHLPERRQLPSGRIGARVALEGVTGALERPDEAVFTSIFLPTEIFLAMDLRPLVAEALADFITGARAPRRASCGPPSSVAFPRRTARTTRYSWVRRPPRPS